MAKVISYRDLIAWQKAMTLAELVYRLTEDFPPRERFGLAFEARRSAVSVPSNIAEGHSQGHGAYVRHLVVAVGSHSELSTQAELSFRLKYIMGNNREKLEALLREVGRITQGLLDSVKTQSLIPDPRSLFPDPRSLIAAPFTARHATTCLA
jgi:four helix bundle protein